jgi:hypothetical protein
MSSVTNDGMSHILWQVYSDVTFTQKPDTFFLSRSPAKSFATTNCKLLCDTTSIIGFNTAMFGIPVYHKSHC